MTYENAATSAIKSYRGHVVSVIWNFFRFYCYCNDTWLFVSTYRSNQFDNVRYMRVVRHLCEYGLRKKRLWKMTMRAINVSRRSYKFLGWIWNFISRIAIIVAGCDVKEITENRFVPRVDLLWERSTMCLLIVNFNLLTIYVGPKTIIVPWAMPVVKGLIDARWSIRE